MKDGPKNTNGADNPMLPAVVDRETWQARIDQLRVKEKAHTRAGDALAAERRRLPHRGRRKQRHRPAGRPIAQWPRIKAGLDDDLDNGAR